MKLPDDTLETVRVTRLLPRGGACTMPAHGWVWPHEQTGRFGFVTRQARLSAVACPELAATYKARARYWLAMAGVARRMARRNGWRLP
jgi:hypothetical protein